MHEVMTAFGVLHAAYTKCQGACGPLHAPNSMPLQHVHMHALCGQKFWPQKSWLRWVGCISLTEVLFALPQYFWFRHAFLLNRTGADQIQGAALALLHDRKLEVQDMAAALLAGLLKGLTPTTFSQLRQQCIQQAETLFPAKRHRKKAAAAAGQKHHRAHAIIVFQELHLHLLVGAKHLHGCFDLCPPK